jgi:hypothetical protein
MATLVEIYKEHAEACLRAAAKMDDPKRRDLMLKLATEWRRDAEALRQSTQHCSKIKGEVSRRSN